MGDVVVMPTVLGTMTLSTTLALTTRLPENDLGTVSSSLMQSVTGLIVSNQITTTTQPTPTPTPSTPTQISTVTSISTKTMTPTTTPTSTPTTTPTPAASSISTNAKIGMGIAIPTLVIFLIVSLLFLWQRRRRDRITALGNAEQVDGFTKAELGDSSVSKDLNVGGVNELEAGYIGGIAGSVELPGETHYRSGGVGQTVEVLGAVIPDQPSGGRGGLGVDGVGGRRE